MATLTVTPDRAEVLQAVAARQVYARTEGYFRYTPRDSIDVTTMVWMFEGIGVVQLGSDEFFNLTAEGERVLADYLAQAGQ